MTDSDPTELGLAEQFGIDRVMAALDTQEAQNVLIYHYRKDIKGCVCGWGSSPSQLGASHAAHVLGEIVAVIRAALVAGDRGAG